MKRRIPVFLAAFLLLSSAGASAWEIESFDVELAVQRDGSVRVTETILADFQGEERHGIYRDIPLQTEDPNGIRRSVRLAFLDATDKEGRPWEALLTREGAYQRIRLGSQSATTSGRKSFRIRYRVDRALGFFPDHDELYWNATGNGWAVPIHQASAIVRLPASVPLGQLRAVAYTGTTGSRASDVAIAPLGSEAVRYTATRPLNPYEGMTIVAGWPKGIVSIPSPGKRVQWFLMDNGYLLFPFLALLAMGIFWWWFGRDPRRGPIAVQYDPPDGLNPAEVGTLVDERVDGKDITASIVDLARRGYLRIEAKGGDETILNRTRSASPDDKTELKLHEKLLLGGLFPRGDRTELSDLENKFYTDLPPIRRAVYKQMEKYWWGRPDHVKVFWELMAAALIVLGSLVAVAFEVYLPVVPTLLSMLISGLIVSWFGRYMPRKTPSGIRTMEHVLGLQEFLSRTDADRLRQESDPRVLFERLLPYAMVLGVANQWAKAFEGIVQEPPSWYSTSGGETFSPSRFTRGLNSAARQMGTVLTSAPRSSGGSGFGGGGSSGGGGGGGGGGAW